MRLLANENVPLPSVEALRAAGHDVAWVRKDRPGSSDEEVLAWAQAEDRLLLTHDKDFGDLAFHAGLPATSGVILIRLGQLLPQEIADRTVQVLASRPDWAGHLSVVEPHRVRMRSLPPV